jgi:hypothetical protein
MITPAKQPTDSIQLMTSLFLHHSFLDLRQMSLYKIEETVIICDVFFKTTTLHKKVKISSVSFAYCIVPDHSIEMVMLKEGSRNVQMHLHTLLIHILYHSCHTKPSSEKSFTPCVWLHTQTQYTCNMDSIKWKIREFVICVTKRGGPCVCVTRKWQRNSTTTLHLFGPSNTFMHRSLPLLVGYNFKRTYKNILKVGCLHPMALDGNPEPDLV